MPFVHVREPSEAAGLEQDLARDRRIALDCEAAGFHRYSDRLCLLQITTASATYVVDPLAFDPTELLQPPLEDPDVEVVMHGADYDLRLLSRDLGIRVRGLFDTQVAAALLGESALGLQALLEARLGVTLAKKYQRADWAERPLSDAMLDYAANDTRYLPRLADSLMADLVSAGREAWAREECRAVEEAAVQTADEAGPSEDPVVRVKGARDLSAREVTALRKALEWRDAIARSRDKAPFRVVGDQPLLEAVLARPLDAQQLGAIKGFPRGLARADGGALLSLFDQVAQAPDKDLRPYPRRSGGPGRPSPEVEELAERLKLARNRRAEELGLDRGTLLPNALLIAIATLNPRDAAGLARVEGLRRWQREAVGNELLAVLNGRR